MRLPTSRRIKIETIPEEQVSELSTPSGQFLEICNSSTKFYSPSAVRSPRRPYALVEDRRQFDSEKSIDSSTSFRTIFRTKKYIWQTKKNLHIHIIQHFSRGYFEIIAYDTNALKEARTYILTELCYDWVANANLSNVIAIIDSELTKLKQNEFNSLKNSSLYECVRNAIVSTIIINKMQVLENPFRVYIPTNGVPLTADQLIPNEKPLELPNLIIQRGDNIIGNVESEVIDSVFESFNSSVLFVFNRLINMKASSDIKFDIDAILYRPTSPPSKPSKGTLLYRRNRGYNKLSTSEINRTNKKIGQSNPISAKIIKQCSFDKFGEENELLMETLGYLDVYELMVCHCVSKKWSVIIPIVLKNQRKVIIEPRPRRDLKLNADKNARQNYVSVETVKRIFNKSHSIESLKLDYVILNDETIDMLKSFDKKLNHLSIGILKIEPETTRALKAARVKTISRRGSTTRNHIQELANKATLNVDEEIVMCPAFWPYFDGDILNRLLKRCGSVIETLELSVLIGSLPQDIFSNTPLLRHLVALDSSLVHRPNELNVENLEISNTGFDDNLKTFAKSEIIMYSQNQFEGAVNLRGFEDGMKGIRMSEVLQVMLDSINEPMLLTDVQGNIVVVNVAFEKSLGYTSEQCYKKSFLMLLSTIAKEKSVRLISSALSKKSQPAIETTTFLNVQVTQPTQEKQVVLCQVVILPDVGYLRELDVYYDCLTAEFIESVIENDRGGGEGRKET